MSMVHRMTRRRAAGALGAATATLALPGLVRAAVEPLVFGRTVASVGVTGYLMSETGKGIQAAFDEANERGGIDGRTLKLVTLDDGGSVEKATENARLLLQRERSFAFIGCGGTTSVLGTLPVVKDAQVPLIAPGTGLDQLRAYNPLVIHTRASYATEVARIVQQLSIINQGRCAVVYNDNVLGSAMLAAFDAAAHKVGNVQWKAFLLQESRDAIGRVVDEISAWQPASRMGFNSGDNAFEFTQALVQKCKAQPFQISLGGAKPVLDRLGDAAKGTTVCQVMPSPENMSMRIVRDYSKAIGKQPGAQPNYASIEGYIGARVMIEALRRAGANASRERFVAAFQGMRPYDLGGYEVSYAPGDHGGSVFTELTYFNGTRYVR